MVGLGRTGDERREAVPVGRRGRSAGARVGRASFGRGLPDVPGSGDRPARRRGLLRGDGRRRRRRRQARRGRGGRGRGLLVSESVLDPPHRRQGRDRARQRLHPGPRRRRRRQGRPDARGVVAADEHDVGRHGPVARAGRRPDQAVEGPPDRPGADDPPRPVGRRPRDRQAAARRRAAPGARDEGAELGRGVRRPDQGLHRPPRPDQGPLGLRGRRRLAPRDAQPSGRQVRQRRAGDDPGRGVGGGVPPRPQRGGEVVARLSRF